MPQSNSKIDIKKPHKAQKRHPLIQSKTYQQEIKALMKQDDTILDLLKRDHREMQKICKKILKRRSSPRSQIADMFNNLKELVLAHSAAEEKIFYTEVLNAADEENDVRGHNHVLEGFEEHHMAAGLLEEMSRLDVGDGRFMAKMNVLSEVLNHHIEEEESFIFKAAKKDLKRKVLSQLAPKFVREETLILRH